MTLYNTMQDLRNSSPPTHPSSWPSHTRSNLKSASRYGRLVPIVIGLKKSKVWATFIKFNICYQRNYFVNLLVIFLLGATLLNRYIYHPRCNSSVQALSGTGFGKQNLIFQAPQECLTCYYWNKSLIILRVTIKYY